MLYQQGSKQCCLQPQDLAGGWGEGAGEGGGGGGGEGEGKGEGKRGLKSWGLEATGT